MQWHLPTYTQTDAAHRQIGRMLPRGDKTEQCPNRLGSTKRPNCSQFGRFYFVMSQLLIILAGSCSAKTGDGEKSRLEGLFALRLGLCRLFAVVFVFSVVAIRFC